MGVLSLQFSVVGFSVYRTVLIRDGTKWRGLALEEVYAPSMQDDRKLHVWERAHKHAIGVRKVTRRFPRNGYGSVTSQMTSAVESIAFNIVE